MEKEETAWTKGKERQKMGREVSGQEATALLELLEKIEDGYAPSEEEKGYLEDITEVTFMAQAIEQLPESVGECKNLQSLDLSGTQITKLPEWLGKCENLQSLDLRASCIL